MHQDDNDFDFTKKAADHLREVGKSQGLPSDIGSGHAHLLVAAAFGYASRTAMQADPDGPYFQNQWLSREAGNVEEIGEAIGRMRKTKLRPDHAPLIARIIQDGLTPACAECHTDLVRTLPLGDVEPGNDTEWVCPRCASDEDQFGHCACCGDHILYRLDDLDEQGLCEEHRGEFDMDPEEEEDWESRAEYLQKDD